MRSQRVSDRGTGHGASIRLHTAVRENEDKWQCFLDVTPNAQATRDVTNQPTSKLKTPVHQRTQLITGSREKNTHKTYTSWGFKSRTRKERLQLNKKTKYLDLKRGKGPEETFVQTRKATQHRESSEMQIKTTGRYHLTPIIIVLFLQHARKQQVLVKMWRNCQRVQCQ